MTTRQKSAIRSITIVIHILGIPKDAFWLVAPSPNAALHCERGIMRASWNRKENFKPDVAACTKNMDKHLDTSLGFGFLLLLMRNPGNRWRAGQSLILAQESTGACWIYWTIKWLGTWLLGQTIRSLFTKIQNHSSDSKHGRFFWKNGPWMMRFYVFPIEGENFKLPEMYLLHWPVLKPPTSCEHFVRKIWSSRFAPDSWNWAMKKALAWLILSCYMAISNKSL